MSLTMPSREFLVRQAVLNTVNERFGVSPMAYVTAMERCASKCGYLPSGFTEAFTKHFHKLTSHYGEGELRT